MSENTKRITPAELGLPEAFVVPRRADWRIGMVGFGHIARHAHAPAYRSAGWTIAAVADPDPEARKEAEKIGVPRTYADFREMIADDDLEIVDLLTQPNVRSDVVLAAAQAGKHVIVEKPLAETIEECKKMVEAAERAGVKLAVHQNYRWYPMCFLARHIIERGFIGEPFFASIEVFGRQDADLAGHPFYSRCDNFLTVQWDNHLADLLRYFLGRDASRVFARTGRMIGQNFASDNLLVVVADFGEGATGHILHSELQRSRLGCFQCRVDGDKGSLLFDFWNSLKLDSAVLGEGIRDLDTSEIRLADSFCGSMGDFLAAVEEDREPLVSGRRNLATIRTILAEDESARTGGEWVDIRA